MEASPLLEDNQWVLDLAAKEPVIVGVVANVEPESPTLDVISSASAGTKSFLVSGAEICGAGTSPPIPPNRNSRAISICLPMQGWRWTQSVVLPWCRIWCG